MMNMIRAHMICNDTVYYF